MIGLREKCAQDDDRCSRANDKVELVAINNRTPWGDNKIKNGDCFLRGIFAMHGTERSSAQPDSPKHKGNPLLSHK